MKIKNMYGLLCVIALLSCHCANPPTNATSAEEDVLKVENNWVNAFNNMDSKLMSSLYWHSTKTQVYSPNVFSDASSSFPAVLSNGWALIEAVFKEYSKQPKGVFTWSLRDTQVTMLTDEVAQVIGYHELVKKPAAGSESSSVSLRFTHLAQKIEGKWLIVYSHETKLQPARQPMSPAGGEMPAGAVSPGGAVRPAGPAGPPGASTPAGVAGPSSPAGAGADRR
jgi:hypothetical protein